MIESCDTNVLLHAVVPSDPLHAKASRYLQSKVADDRFAICELALAELYVLLRNPKVCAKPLSAPQAVKTIQGLRSNIHWQVLDYPGGLMDQLWDVVATDDFPRGGIFDARTALTLRHYGVTRFATRNVKHFQGYGFDEVFDPTA